MKKIAIIVPCYNEAECVRKLSEKVAATFLEIKDCKYTILYIDDGSKDNTLKEIKKIAEEKGNDIIQYLSFARNFGKEAAIFAGLSHIGDADLVALMDADLQHPPELLKKMIFEIEVNGHDCCGARRISRDGEPVIRSFFSNGFYKWMNRVTAMNLVPGGSDFRVMKRQVAEAIISLPETERFTKGIFSWVGFDTKWIEYENVERFAGETKWSFGGLIRYAVNGFMAFATAPLRFAIYTGILITIASFIYLGMILYGAWRTPQEQRTGYSTMVILLLFLGGVIISLLGIIGEYLARIYIEVKHRPIFVLKDSNLQENDKE